MDFIVNKAELDALYGLLHFQQLTYLRGIRPYMDVTTGIVGLKRGISYQSIAEQLFIEPHQGIKGSSYSKAQIRRSLSSLERAGLIHLQSQELKLILKCPLATLGYFDQNKPVTKESQEIVPCGLGNHVENKGKFSIKDDKVDTVQTAKTVLPLNSNNNYFFLYAQFEKFWLLYPIKTGRQKTWEIFQQLNPSEALVAEILTSLQTQINFIQSQQLSGHWVPNWKNPTNWLAQKCWEDQIDLTLNKEKAHEKHERHPTRKSAYDRLWESCKGGLEFDFDSTESEWQTNSESTHAVL